MVQDTNALNIRANYGMILSETYIIKQKPEQYHDSTAYTLSCNYQRTSTYYNMLHVYTYNGDFHLKVKGTNKYTTAYQWNYGIGVGDTILSDSTASGNAVILTGSGQKGFRYGSLANPTLDRASGDVPTNTELVYELIRIGNTYRGIITKVSDESVLLDKTITYESPTSLDKLYVWVNQAGVFNIKDIQIDFL